MAENKTRLTLSNLSKYDLLTRQWTSNLVTEKIGALGKVLNLKGRKDTLELVQAVVDPKVGDVWMVGSEGSDSFEEYFYTDSGNWEFMGVTRASLDGYVTETSLYKGTDGTGTAAAPADGTILAAITAMISTNATDIGALEEKVTANTNAITAINAENTGILAQAKSYADGLVSAESAIGQRVAALEVELTDDDIANMFNTNTATLTA